MQRSGRFHQGSLKTEIAQQIRQMVFTGELVSGTKIDQDALADEFGVSKLPIRESLIALESEGLAINEPRRGWYVAEITPEDILDHYRILSYVSGLAAGRAAERLDQETRDRLAGVYAKMSPHDDGDRSEFEDLNFEFHWLVNSTTSSRRLRSVLRLFSEAIPARFFEIVDTWPAVAHEDHRRILEAILDEDAEAAQAAMTEHIFRGGTHAVTYLTERGFWGDEGDGSVDTEDRLDVEGHRRGGLNRRLKGSSSSHVNSMLGGPAPSR